MIAEIRDTCRKAVATFGTQKQASVAIEECAELIAAIEHFRRGRATVDEVITEIADVMITTSQLALMFGEEKVTKEVWRKIRRLQERVEDYKQTHEKQ